MVPGRCCSWLPDGGLHLTRNRIVHAQALAPTAVDRNLAVRTVVADLDTPTSMAFLGLDDFLILERATGKVKRVTGGVMSSTVLDLRVNSASERGLLGSALHPRFPTIPSVYLYWTQSSTGADSMVLARGPAPRQPCRSFHLERLDPHASEQFENDPRVAGGCWPAGSRKS
jgi:glucose/arabinose dehydrogenase